MLINTVIIFLKDLLPIFILLCLLCANNYNAVFLKFNIILLIAISLFGIIATFYFLPFISELWGGSGIEVIQSMSLLLIYVFLVFSYSNTFVKKQLSTKKTYFIYCSLAIFIVLQISLFIVFIEGYLVNTESIKNMVAGLSMGLGICLSFSFLFFFLLMWLNKNEYYFIAYSVWGLFLTGQVSQIVNLLQQVDIIQNSGTLWDSSKFIADKSEYGHLFNALFGYEARPSFEFMMVYVGSLVVIYSYYFIQNGYPIEHSKKNSQVRGS